MRTLRQHLILSHILPLLVSMPLLGIALIYVLETQVVLADLSSELSRQAELIADLAGTQPALWEDPRLANDFVNRVHDRLTVDVMLLSPDGRLIASSDPTYSHLLGQLMELPGLQIAQTGQTHVQIEYNGHIDTEIANGLAPVQNSQDASVVGIVRLSRRLADVSEQFNRLRYLIAAILGIWLVLGSAIGWVLALNLERPIRLATLAVRRLADDKPLMPLREQGPIEIRLLLRAVSILAEKLQTLEYTRRQLLANLVHELGRPLGALHSAIHALRNGAEEDPTLRQELLSGMDAEVRRLERLLDDLARLHDQVLGTLQLKRRPINLAEWLPQVLVPWREVAKEHQLNWESTIAPDLPTIEVDPDRLGQALGNLLSNAIKYTPAGGTIRVEAGVHEDQIWLRVTDTGLGISPEELKNIFTPFYRSQRVQRFPEGMGLGLTIARDLVVAHGGRLEVQSTPGQGSQFTIWLPLRQPEQQPA